MPATSITDAVEAEFLAVLSTDTPDDLSGFGMVVSKDYNPSANRPLPYVLLNAGEEARRRTLPNAYDVSLKVFVASDVKDDGDGATHKAAVSALISHLNDKAEVKTDINAASLDIVLHDYWIDSQSTRPIETGEWETEIAFNVVVQTR